VDENLDAVTRRLRKNLQTHLAELDQLLTDVNSVARHRWDLAPKINPDSFADIYRQRDWARKALAALAAGEVLPPSPEE
jgi:hypothetical protein